MARIFTQFYWLHLICKQNTTNATDIKQTSGILGEQGACGSITSPANNTFSHTSAVTLSDINAYTGGGFKYNYNPSPLNGVQDPLYKTANIIKFGCNSLGTFSYNTTTCPSKLTISSGGGGSNGGRLAMPVLEASALRNKAIADSLTEVLNQQLVDGSKQIAIQTMGNPNSLKVSLLANSPYLSDLVLMAYLQKSLTPAATDIKDVLVANSPITANVQQVLNALNLPKGILQQIATAQSNGNAKLDQRNTINYYNHAKDLAVNQLLRNYLRDSSTNAPASIIKWLTWNNSPSSMYDLAFAHIQQGNLAQAQLLIDSLNTLTNNAKHIKYLQHHKSLCATKGKWADMVTNNPLLCSSIKALAADSLSPYMGNARAALSLAYATTTNYQVVEDAQGLGGAHRLAHYNKEIVTDVPTAVNENTLVALKAYPNPFANEITITANVQYDGRIYTLELTEIATGKVLSATIYAKDATVINTSNLANGVYLLHLTDYQGLNKYIKIVKAQ